MKCQELMEYLEELSPKQYAQDWDNVGLLVGDKTKDIRSVFIALDATDEVINEALDCDVDMIITHHPLIFKGMKQVVDDHFIGKRIIRLIQNDINLYAMHTNFDVMGMADAAADELELTGCQVLQKTYEDDISTEGFGRVGKLPDEMSLRDCALYVKECFDISMVTVFGDPEERVEIAAVSPGSGGSIIDSAVEVGADVLITGDIDHHEGIDAVARNLNIIDAGHYGLEHIFVPYMKEYLNRNIPGIKVYTQKLVEPCWFI